MEKKITMSEAAANEFRINKEDKTFQIGETVFSMEHVRRYRIRYYKEKKQTTIKLQMKTGDKPQQYDIDAEFMLLDAKGNEIEGYEYFSISQLEGDKAEAWCKKGKKNIEIKQFEVIDKKEKPANEELN